MKRNLKQKQNNIVAKHKRERRGSLPQVGKYVLDEGVSRGELVFQNGLATRVVFDLGTQVAIAPNVGPSRQVRPQLCRWAATRAGDDDCRSDLRRKFFLTKSLFTRMDRWFPPSLHLPPLRTRVSLCTCSKCLLRGYRITSVFVMRRCTPVRLSTEFPYPASPLLSKLRSSFLLTLSSTGESSFCVH